VYVFIVGYIAAIKNSIVMLEGGNNNEVRLRRQQQFMLVLAVAVILVVFMNRAEDQWFFASTTLVAPAGRTAAVYNGTLKSGNVTSEGSTSPRSLLVPPPPPPPPLFDVQSNVTCEEQNCMIENACIDRGLNRRNPIMIRFFGNNTVAFKKILVAHAAIGNHESNVVFGDVHETNALRIPAEIDPKSTAALAWRFVENCGHDLGDNAVGVLRLLKLFPEYMPENGTLSTLYVTGRSNYCDKVFSLLADEVKIVFHKSFRPPTLKCYRRIFFGLRGIGYMIEGGTWPNREATLERDMRAFRDLYYRNAGVDPTVKRDTLLVMEKRSGSHFSNLGNLTDLVANLTATFPSYRVIRATWSDYNMTEQDFVARI
jgi:hypothetical protein